MKTNHTKDELTPNLVSIDEAKPTKDEHSGVEGVPEHTLCGDNVKLATGYDCAQFVFIEDHKEALKQAHEQGKRQNKSNHKNQS